MLMRLRLGARRGARRPTRAPRTAEVVEDQVSAPDAELSRSPLRRASPASCSRTTRVRHRRSPACRVPRPGRRQQPPRRASPSSPRSERPVDEDDRRLRTWPPTDGHDRANPATATSVSPLEAIQPCRLPSCRLLRRPLSHSAGGPAPLPVRSPAFRRGQPVGVGGGTGIVTGSDGGDLRACIITSSSAPSPRRGRPSFTHAPRPGATIATRPRPPWLP